MKSMKYTDSVCNHSLVKRNETLFTLANGYLGLRGDTEEADGSFHKGTYINGLYDTEPIIYGETAYGYAKNHETILNLPDPKRIELEIDGQPFSLKRGVVSKSTRTLDFSEGTLTRHVDYLTDNAKHILLDTLRLVSFEEKHCAVIRYKVTACEKPVHIKITSYLDVSAQNRGAEEDPRIGSKFSSRPLRILGTEACDDMLFLSAEGRHTKIPLSCCIVHTLSSSAEQKTYDQEAASISYFVDLEAGSSVTLEKFIAYTTEAESAQQLALDAKQKGLGYYVSRQTAFLEDFWRIARIGIDGDQECEQALHFNLFHLLQSCGRDAKSSLAAKGLTGEGYEGHYFWDTEAYALPVFAYLKHDVALSLLQYRYNTLEKARQRAKTMSLEGALFPWRTISGEECSAYYPAGTAQYHIDADIMYAAEKYLYASGKECPSFMVEMAIETARMWVSLGSFIQNKGGAFCINEVTGPDEYTACVNNNAYTNLMAQHNLRFALKLVRDFENENRSLPIALEEGELELWDRAQKAMYIPFNAKLGIYEQDDSFLSKQPWPFDQTPKDKYPLLLHYHPLVIYRHRVLKQPDLVLVQFLLSGLFSKAEKIRNFSFYEPYTTGDSSLSHCIQSIMAMEAGYYDKAWDYFKKTVRMDIDDIHGNSVDGIHTAAMAGSWMSVVYGFAGFRDWQGVFSFDPKLPEAWTSLKFRLQLRSSVVELFITKDEVCYRLHSGPSIELRHRNEIFTLVQNEEKVFSLKAKLKAVIFDLDGVLVDTANLHYLAWKAVSDEQNLVFDREVNKGLLGISRAASLQVILDHNNVQWPEELKNEVLKKKNEIYKESLNTLNAESLLDGVGPMLQELKENGIKIALASASRNARTVCDRLGILSYFDAISDVDKVQLPKPQPDLFLYAAQLLDEYPLDCLGVEDALAGIEAIKKAGMKAVAVSLDTALADCCVKDSSHLSLKLFEEVMQS